MQYRKADDDSDAVPISDAELEELLTCAFYDSVPSCRLCKAPIPLEDALNRCPHCGHEPDRGPRLEPKFLETNSCDDGTALAVAFHAVTSLGLNQARAAEICSEIALTYALHVVNAGLYRVRRFAARRSEKLKTKEGSP